MTNIASGHLTLILVLDLPIESSESVDEWILFDVLSTGATLGVQMGSFSSDAVGFLLLFLYFLSSVTGLFAAVVCNHLRTSSLETLEDWIGS